MWKLEDAEDYYRALEQELEELLRLQREAFVMSLAHFWERWGKWLVKEDAALYQNDQANQKTRSRWQHYDHTMTMEVLKRHNFQPSSQGLEQMRLVANVVKHGTGNSSKTLFKECPRFFPGVTTEDEASYESLRVGDADVMTFFELVRISIAGGVKVRGA